MLLVVSSCGDSGFYTRLATPHKQLHPCNQSPLYMAPVFDDVIIGVPDSVYPSGVYGLQTGFYEDAIH